MRALEEAGIRTVINLRSLYSDRDEIGDADLQYVHIPMAAWRVEKRDIIEFLSVVTDETRAPVLVHCNYGADRTGFMSAIYRVCVCGWPKDEAIEEMVNGGFGFHRIWGNLVDSVEELDVRSARAEAGLTRSSPVRDNTRHDRDDEAIVRSSTKRIYSLFRKISRS
jgi:protein tyrosine/serine phosphatase